ncbi:MAG: Spore protein SP21 [Calditrichaeota bacterium]|nr:Spore protein SP21 [Calditrichota bacterium]
MTMHRWNPARELTRWMDLIDEINGEQGEMKRAWAPRIDIVEDEHEFRMLADLPGADRDSVEITLEDGVLTVSGERPAPERAKDESWQMNERAYGRFVRRFTVRETIDADRIHASFRDGVLSIRLPKLEAAKPRKIEIDSLEA